MVAVDRAVALAEVAALEVRIAPGATAAPRVMTAPAAMVAVEPLRMAEELAAPPAQEPQAPRVVARKRQVEPVWVAPQFQASPVSPRAVESQDEAPAAASDLTAQTMPPKVEKEMALAWVEPIGSRLSAEVAEAVEAAEAAEAAGATEAGARRIESNPQMLAERQVGAPVAMAESLGVLAVPPPVVLLE